MRLHMEGQELLTHVNGAHVHETDPWGSGAIGVHDRGVQPWKEGCEGRGRRPVAALRMRGGQQRWAGIGGLHGGGLALEDELGVHARHAMPGGEEHGDVAARVRGGVLLASGGPPAFVRGQRLATRLVDVGDAAAIGDGRIVQCPLDLLLAQFSGCPCRCCGPILPSSPLGFLKECSSDRMNFRDWRAEKRC